MKVEVAVLSSPSQSCRKGAVCQKLCESRGGRPELPVPIGPYGLCGRKAALNLVVGQSSGAV